MLGAATCSQCWSHKSWSWTHYCPSFLLLVYNNLLVVTCASRITAHRFQKAHPVVEVTWGISVGPCQRTDSAYAYYCWRWYVQLVVDCIPSVVRLYPSRANGPMLCPQIYTLYIYILYIYSIYSIYIYCVYIYILYSTYCWWHQGNTVSDTSRSARSIFLLGHPPQILPRRCPGLLAGKQTWQAEMSPVYILMSIYTHMYCR